ncbi:putative iron (III) dicitrate transport ATP-binding protein [Gottschalkia acidurici 9a]|uniref:Iron (III) dicitrate transport ATP-binding protein n=1 Tax=Gottschalkia acidurici (strain ATCC 7906 / DSM 604 / BCRC 14475 / CIP 104303 / KCTC 5404 / NCIMB 10678 / 9a) TaxID=1128398 RepID=K0B2U1_GOTA9|nr:ABC transporter ATP-binding protein [Gottschalkia acidurici]AFS79457.1 putative iron (III) dicitrate transport ATP-binding protein [Gottschalkia acidurici 9a]
MSLNKHPLITITNLNWSYSEEAILKDINIDFYSNRIYGIIGPNGSGKTTLLKNISRALLPKEETIFLQDKDLTSFSNKELSKIVSYVPQNTNLEFEFSVMDIVLMGRSPYLKRFQSESESDIDIAVNAMKITNTWHLRDKNIGQVSGGERQRAIIARALAQQTDIMILDEPVSQLDIQHQIEILDILKGLAENKKLTVILSLHDLNISSEYCEHLILMDKGKIFKSGTPEEIISEENINKVYNIRALTMKNPLTGKPHIIPYMKK